MRRLGSTGRLRAYAYTGVTTGIVLVFALAEWWSEKYVADRSRIASTAIEIAVVLIAAVVFNPLHKFVEAKIEAAFTKRRREAREAIARLRREVTSFSDTNQLLRRVIEAVDHHMEAAASAIYLRRDVYRAEASSFDERAENVDVDDALAIRLRSTAKPADPVALRSSASGEIAFPMTVAGELVGFLCISKRIEYEPEDVAGLAALAEAAGLAAVALDPRLRSQSASVPNNLPAGLLPLIGRDEELGEIKTLLEQTRLVTLTGAGGIGKTRIALHVASELVRYDDGVWFVDLAPLGDAMHVPSAIADAFKIADEGGSLPLIDRVAATLKEKHLLIVLDNCEHLVKAAADAVDRLLQACPRISVLATSREPLGVAGEEPYHMPTLPVPPEGVPVTAESVLQYGAAALFVARAHTAQRTFALDDASAEIVADIVRRLDGIALAIELAAPRVKVLTLEQLTQRLDERFKLLSGGSRTAQPRHQTLRALIGWSYDLLSEGERSLVRRSAIFRGGWTLDAAEAVCADERIADWNVLDLLEALVDKSLVVVHDEGRDRRYRMLESTRQYALERLDEAGERAEIAARHCRYFAAGAERAGDAYWRTDSDRWTAEVRRDVDNDRAAIAWSLRDGGDAVSTATIVANLRWFWYATARREGHALLERAEVIPIAGMPVRLRALLSLTGVVLDNSARAEVPAEAAARELEGVDQLAWVEALTFQGIALGRAGRVAEAIAIFDRAVPAVRTTHVPRLVGWVLSMVAYWTGAAGDTARAREFFDEAAGVLRTCDDAWQLARMHLHRAEFLFAQDDLDGALHDVREAEAVFRERNAESILCVAVLNAAAYLLAMRRFDEAWECSREGLDLALRHDSAMAVAWAIGHVAELAAENGDAERSARLLGYAGEAYRKTGTAREPTEQRGYDRALELIRDELPEDRIRALMAEGASWELDSIAAEAAAAAPASERRTA